MSLKGAVIIAAPTAIVALVTAAAVMPTVVAHDVENRVEINNKLSCIRFFKTYLYLIWQYILPYKAPKTKTSAITN